MRTSVLGQYLRCDFRFGCSECSGASYGFSLALSRSLGMWVISYDALEELLAMKHLGHTSDTVLDEFDEEAE